MNEPEPTPRPSSIQLPSPGEDVSINPPLPNNSLVSHPPPLPSPDDSHSSRVALVSTWTPNQVASWICTWPGISEHFSREASEMNQYDLAEIFLSHSVSGSTLSDGLAETELVSMGISRSVDRQAFLSVRRALLRLYRIPSIDLSQEPSLQDLPGLASQHSPISLPDRRRSVFVVGPSILGSSGSQRYGPGSSFVCFLLARHPTVNGFQSGNPYLWCHGHVR